MTRNEDPSNQRRFALVAAIGFVVVAANALGYVVYRSRQRAEPVVVAPPVPSSAPVASPLPPASPSPDPMKALAVEQRDRALEHLRAGEYVVALAELEAAAKLDPTLREIPTLIELAEKLRARGSSPPPAPARPQGRADTRPEVRPSPVPVAASARAARAPDLAPGVLLVTTTPARLLVKVDGQGLDLTPARIEVAPGRHVVEIVLGGKTVLERTVELQPGQSTVISETFGEPGPRTALEATPAPRPAGPGLEDEKLDLVGLIDRAPSESARPASAESARPTGARVEAAKSPGRTASPSLFVVWVGNGAGLEKTLEAGMGGVDVQVFASANELRAAMGRETPDGILASGTVLKGAGLTPTLLGTGARAPYVAASLRDGLSKGELGQLTLGVVEDGAKKAVEERVNGLVGGRPRLRRVAKTDDLLPLLQLKMADAVLVREAELPELRARTRQTLYTVSLGGTEVTRAVAFTEGSRRSVVERALLGLGAEARTQLGVDKWSKE